MTCLQMCGRASVRGSHAHRAVTKDPDFFMETQGATALCSARHAEGFSGKCGPGPRATRLAMRASMPVVQYQSETTPQRN